MTTEKYKQILDALSHLDMETLLNYLPEDEFKADGKLTQACRIAGYSKSAFHVVSENYGWDLTLGDLVDFIADDDA